MNDVQRQAVAAGFIHALGQSSDTLARWSAIAKNDHVVVGAFIQETLGLAEPPSADDLSSMSSHVQRNLQPQVSAIQEQNEDVVNHVGSFMMMQQG
ncbi:MAG TPA: hypothetical protein VMW12_04065 [Candidatus Dormibacteraeota bacterium]|nr:hypothetical protein [Candidatus Dormibacteraeota bacterium]